MWGNGNGYMIAVSLVQLLCAAYSFLMAHTMDMDMLRSLISYKTFYLLLVGLVSAPIGLLSLVTLYAFQQADQLGAYTVSSHALSWCFITLFPFLTLVLFTYFLWQIRAYELDD